MPKIYGSSEIWGDLLVTGSFSILGSASSIYTTSLVVSDTLIALGHSQSGSPLLDEGIMFTRGTGLTQAFIWDETNDTFALIGTNDDHTVIGSVNIDSYSNLRVGGITTSNITITDGAANGYLLQSDASGNATWLSATSASANFANTDLTLTGNRIHDTNGNDLSISSDGNTLNDFIISFEGTSSLTVGHVNYFQEFTSSDLSIQQFGGTRRLEINATETIFGTINNNFDFIIKGNTNENLFFVDASSDRVGIGTASPAYLFQIDGGNGSTFYFDPTSGGGRYNLLGTTGLPRYDVSIPAYLSNLAAGGSVGMRTWDDSTYTGYGQVGDMHVYAGNSTNGLNIISSPGTATEDYIRFYAGQVATGTADIHIQGDGSTRGFVGIGLTAPSYKLEVSGTVSTIGFRMTSGASNGYVLTSDAFGNATWQASSGGVGGLTGSGTNNYLAKWNSTGGLTGSIIYNNGNNVGINSWAANSTMMIDSNNELVSLYVTNATLTNGSAPTSKYGINTSLTGFGSSLTNIGIYSGVSDGATNNFGFYSAVSGASGSNNYAYYSVIDSSGTNNYGLYIDSYNASNNYGIVVNRGTTIFNESGNANSDFRIEGDTNANLFFLDASADKIGIGTNAPVAELDVRGSTVINNANSSSYNFTVKGSSDSTLLATQASNNVAGVGGYSSNTKFSISSTSTSHIVTLGVQNISGTSSGTNYAISASSTATNTGTNYGLYVNSANANTNYGVVVENGTSVFNNSGDANSDFRIAGDTSANLFFVDASTDRIGVRTPFPTYDFTVVGTASATALRGNFLRIQGTGTIAEFGYTTGATNLEIDAQSNGTGLYFNKVGTITGTSSFTQYTTYFEILGHSRTYFNVNDDGDTLLTFGDNSENDQVRFYMNSGAGTVPTVGGKGVYTAYNLRVNGTLSKGAGTFQIDHPLPELEETHTLSHSFIEGPYADNIYRGKTTLINGQSEINLDTEFNMTQGTIVALNKNFQCFTTNETSWDAVRGQLNGNILTIQSQNPNSVDEISWMVVGERQDKVIKSSTITDENGRVIVEKLKV